MSSGSPFDRRSVLKLGGIVALSVTGFDLTGCEPRGSEGESGRWNDGADGFSGGDDDIRVLTSEATLPTPFTAPLPTPPVLSPVRRRGGRDHYDLVQEVGQQEILPGTQTTVWGYNGHFPGPTFETRSGSPIVVKISNRLPVPTTTHLHGGITPSSSDGYPTDLTVPDGYTDRVDAASSAMGEGSSMSMGGVGDRPDPSIWTTHHGSREYHYPLAQRAAMLWYHDHRMDFTGPQVWRGLAGAFIVRDEHEDALDLPRGDKELVLVLSDRAFAASGELLYPSVDATLTRTSGVQDRYMGGVTGDVVLVNGAPWPVATVANTRYRLRLLNASNARHYELQLTADRSNRRPNFTQIGSDGGLLPRPQTLTTIPVAPAERFDVIVDFSAYPVGTELVLSNLEDKSAAGQVMKFVVGRREPETSAPVPAQLTDDYETLDPAMSVATRTFEFNQDEDSQTWTINGHPFDPTESLASPRLGTVERWRLRTEWTRHPVHIHLGHFQVLSRGGRAPDPSDAGWKDTVSLTGDGDVEVLVKFTGFKGRYMLHCHNLEHEDMAMMANFNVI